MNTLSSLLYFILDYFKNYLPLTGGTLTGTLNGTDINASGDITDGSGNVLANMEHVVERGTDYVRYASGLQICWINSTVQMALNTAYGSLYQGSYTWTFPKAFSSAPVVSVGAVRWGAGASWGTLAGSPTTTYAGLRGIDAVSRASGSTLIQAIAIGIWE